MILLPHDWPDVLLHVGIAAILTAALTFAGFPILAIIANSIGWPLREAIQARTWPCFWNAQKHWEAWAPVLVGWLVTAEALARGTHG